MLQLTASAVAAYGCGSAKLLCGGLRVKKACCCFLLLLRDCCALAGETCPLSSTSGHCLQLAGPQPVLLVSLCAQRRPQTPIGLGAACTASQDRAGSMGRGRAWHACSGRWRPRWQSDRLDLAVLRHLDSPRQSAGVHARHLRSGALGLTAVAASQGSTRGLQTLARESPRRCCSTHRRAPQTLRPCPECLAPKCVPLLTQRASPSALSSRQAAHRMLLPCRRVRRSRHTARCLPAHMQYTQ
jgi:hypothetical protein